MKIFAKIRAIYVMLIVALFVGLMIPLVSIFKKWNSFLRGITSKLILFFSGVKLVIEGKPADGVNMFILNHQSMIDIMALESATGKFDVAWVAKKELFDMKYFGLSLSLTNMIELNREDRAGIIKLLKDVKDRTSKGRVVAIFPEGTRNVENKFLPFKQGASIVANKHQLKVQPVILVNTAKRFDTKNILASGGEVKVIFLDPFVATKERDWLNESREEMLKRFLQEVED
jgi:1-acyl-sn-glycerol-3-phosphate acyltransferase